MNKQKLSLQEQLLKSGLVSSAKAKAMKTEQRKKNQQQRKNNLPPVDEAKLLAQKAQAEKTEKARELNQKRVEEDAKKQLAAQIKQLLDTHRLATDPNGEPYHFTDQNKVKTLYVSESMRNQLGNGRLAIVKHNGDYAVVTLEAAQKIRDRSPESIVLLNSKTGGDEDKEDPYAAFQVPDDLMW